MRRLVAAIAACGLMYSSSCALGSVEDTVASNNETHQEASAGVSNRHLDPRIAHEMMIHYNNVSMRLANGDYEHTMSLHKQNVEEQGYSWDENCALVHKQNLDSFDMDFTRLKEGWVQLLERFPHETSNIYVKKSFANTITHALDFKKRMEAYECPLPSLEE